MKRSTVSLICQYAFALIGVSIAAARPAHAYLDPGTGSYAFQVGVAGVFGALFSAKMFWTKLRRNLGSNRGAIAGHKGGSVAQTSPEQGEETHTGV